MLLQSALKDKQLLLLLAIELAAAHIKYFPPQTLLTRLEQGLSVLSGGARDLPIRQQTLRGAIAWSYDLLSPEEQQLFRRLSVFVSGCTLETAELVCTAAGPLEGDLLEGLTSLVDKSLLHQAEEAEGTLAEGESRFLMLYVLREYGLEVLAESQEMEATRQAHAVYYLALAEEVEPQLRSAQQSLWLARLESEHDNLRAALRWLREQGVKEMTLRLSGALWYFWELGGHWSEGRNELLQALAASEGVATAVRAKALSGASMLVSQQGDHQQAMALCEQSLALSRQLGETAGIALSLCNLGTVAWLRGNAEESLALLRKIDYQSMIAYCLEHLAAVAVAQGQPTVGVQLWGAVERLREGIGLPRPPLLGLLYEQAVASVRTALSEEAFATAWAQGRTAPLEQVITDVLKMDGEAGRQ